MATRPTYNGLAQIVVGDTTSHGGVVISGSPTTVWGPSGLPIARVGDQVTCPMCKPHVFKIVEGQSMFTDNHMAIALHGHKIGCGATLIAKPAELSQIIPSPYHENAHWYDDKYVLRDSSGGPLPNTDFAVKYPDGLTEFSRTNDKGETNLCVTKEQARELTFYIAD